MEFLAPVFAIAGLAAAGVPLVLHLWRRAPTERLPFSLVRFLKPSQPRLTRRSTIEHWPLLLLRILAVLLLGFAFSRPFQRSAQTGLLEDPHEHSVTLLVDRSASMRRSGIRDAVVNEIRATADSLQPSDQMQVVFFSATAETVLTFSEWSAMSTGEQSLAIDRVCRRYAPDWQTTRTGQALLQTADDLLQDAALEADHEIILVTDLQEGSDFSALQSTDWPRAVRVSLRRVTAAGSGNASLRTLVDRRTGRTMVRISNSADAGITRYQIQPATAAGLPAGTETTVDVLPGRRISLPLEQMAAADDATQLVLTGDAHDFDNRTPLPVHQPQVTRIAHVGSTDVNDADDMRYYLQRALDGMATGPDDNSPDRADVAVEDAVTRDGLVMPIDSDIDLAILTSAAPPELLPSLTDVIERGGVLVVALRSAPMAQSIENLLPPGISVTEAQLDDYAMLGKIDFEHPLFARFADGRFADFSSIRFWQHRNIALSPPTDEDPDRPVPWTVIARFDSGQPAIVRVRQQGQGSLYLLASGWHPEDSQWALSSRFAPMLAGFRQLARSTESETLRVQVGDLFDPTAHAATENWQLRRPDGTARGAGEISRRGDDLRQITIDQPGSWQLCGTSEDSVTPVTLLAQLAPEESLTTPLPEGWLYTMQLAGGESPGHVGQPSALSRSADASAEELETQQKYWRWLLLAGLMCLVLEALLAAIIRRRQLPESVR